MNIYDIAELAGVSIATVSRVVNDSPMVSEKTKQRGAQGDGGKQLHTECIRAGLGFGLYENGRTHVPERGRCLYGEGGRLFGAKPQGVRL